MSKPKWLKAAEKDIGIHEFKNGENSRIIQMGSYTTLKPTTDEIPWCSDACCAWMEESGIKSTRSAAAASWINWGIALTKPVEGCIVVIRQKFKGNDKSTGSSSGNHVALFQKIENNRIFLLGGNQSDSVKVSSFGLDNYEILAYRWPEGVNV